MRGVSKLFFCGAILVSFSALSQKPPIKLGDVDLQDLRAEFYSIDSGAAAVVLVDYGFSKFTYNQSTGFVFTFQRTKRVKILSPEGYDFANIEVALYHSNSGRETFGRVKGFTHNLVNGKAQSSKLDKESVFVEDYDENWDLHKFTMPDVKEGSVIEFQYSITSPFAYNLRTWEFQSEIPVLHSELVAVIPEFYDYQQLSYGYHPLAVADHQTQSARINLTSKTRTTTGRTEQSSFANDAIDYREHRFRWVARDVPKFQEEKYMNAASNYITKIEFELRGTKWPNEPYKPIVGTWESLNKSFLDSDGFGIALKRDAFLSDEVAQFADLATPEEKIAAITLHAKKEIEWDGRYGKFAQGGIRKVWNEKKGHSGEINLLLVAMLRAADIEADPVLISTRGHGMVRQNFALSSQFNTVVARARVDDKNYLLDATDKYTPIGTLPVNCINGKGWVVSENSQGWVDLTSSSAAKTSTNAQLALDENGNMSGKFVNQLVGYPSFNNWKAYLQKGDEKYLEEIKEDRKNWEFQNAIFPEEKNVSEDFKEEYDITIKESVESVGNLILVSPMLSEAVIDNPFKMDERQFPVDFIYPRQHMYMLSLSIPEGYDIDALPQPAIVSLPDNAGKFQYSVSTIGTTITVVSIYSINRPLFLPSEYGYLKQFFDLIVDKHSEQITLKKKT